MQWPYIRKSKIQEYSRFSKSPLGNAPKFNLRKVAYLARRMSYG
jgi:hypothetical protein